MIDHLIIDAHLHTYPSPEVGLQAMGGSALSGYTGTVEDTLKAMDKDKVSKAVQASMMPVSDMREAARSRLPGDLSGEQRMDAERQIAETMAGRIRRKNQWVCDVSKQHPQLIPFVTVDPTCMGPESMRQEVLDKVRSHGARGVKLHPPAGRYYPNDRSLWPVYETAQELDLPVLSHAGTFDDPVQWAEPRFFREVASSFSRLRLVLAHLGIGFFDQTKSIAKSYPHVNFDCCAIIAGTGVEGAPSDGEMVSLIREIGAERIMYGSDFPFVDPTPGIQRLLRLNLTDKEKQAILAENAVRIYRL